MLRCNNDHRFGPMLETTPGCYHFDFTLLFEESIFSLLPSALAVLICLFRGIHLWVRTPLVNWPLLRTLKLCFWGALATFQITLVVLWASGDGVRTKLTLPSGIIAFVATLVLALLSYLEHHRDIKPSAILQIFLLFTCLLEATRVRTQWFLKDNATIAPILTVSLGLKMVLLGLESLHKWPHAKSTGKVTSPEMRCGIFGRSLFLWLDPLLWTGYKRDLTVNDLMPVDGGLTGSIVSNRLKKTWKTANQKRKHALAYAVLRNFWPELTMTFFPRILLVGFSLAQPYLVQTTINYITYHKIRPIGWGYGLIGAYACCYLGIAFSTVWYQHLSYRLMTKIRGALVAMIYENMLLIRSESTNASAAMALMSNDVDRVTMTTFLIVNIVPDIIQVALALWILGIKLGPVCIAPIIVSGICAGGAARAGKITPKRQIRWMRAIQKRVGITSDVIRQMKGVKMGGLIEKISAQLQGLRDFELAESLGLRKMQILTLLFTYIPMISMNAVTFVAFAIKQQINGGSQLGVAQAFTSLSLLAILVTPVAELLMAFMTLTSASACLDRIQEFLLKERRIDYRAVTKAHSTVSDDLMEKPEDFVANIEHATLGWTLDKPALKDISLHIPSSKFVLIVGPVASGKSTFLKGLLGETYLIAGSLELADPDDLAYCDQDAWILNQSVKENIVGFLEYSEEWYNTVIAACQLKQDFQELALGDQTKVGSTGSSLSGGQKQRVALARAVYSHKHVVLLDDVMKGLDARTAKKCFRALLGTDGLLRRGRISVIMTTHNAQWLPYADSIVVLSKDGEIAQVGSYEALIASNEYIKALCINQIAPHDTEDTLEQDIPEELQKTRGSMVVQKLPTPPEPGKDTVSRGKRNSTTLFSYLKTLGPLYLAVFLSLGILNVAMSTVQPIWLKFWTAANLKHPNEGIAKWVSVYILFAVLNLVFIFAEVSLYFLIMVPRSAKTLHYGVLRAAMLAPISFFVSTDVGEIVNRFSQDMTLVDMPLPSAFMNVCNFIIQTISQLALTCVSSGYLACMLPFLFAVLFLLQRVYLRTSRQMRLLDLEAKSPLYSHFISSFAGLTTLRAYAWGEPSTIENLKRLDASQSPYYLLYCLQRWLTLMLDLILAAICVLLVGLTVALRDTIDPGLLGVALTSVTGFGQTMSTLITQWTQLETSLGAITRIRQFESETPRETDGKDEPPKAWPDKGIIEVSNLTAKYGDQVVLDDVNLNIQPGEKVAICGRSGSGKSTLIAHLLRLYPVVSGSIQIDGIDISELRLNLLREAVVALPQDAMFLAGTVRYNLDPFSRAEDEEVLAVLEKTGIKEVVMEKGGLEAEMNSDWLSAGQKQLFCFARAGLRKGRVLLLDEATSSLDTENNDLVQKLLREDFADWTIIAVVHRLKTVAHFDKIVVLDKGRVVECDTPANLLKMGGTFKELWDAQD